MPRPGRAAASPPMFFSIERKIESGHHFRSVASFWILRGGALEHASCQQWGPSESGWGDLKSAHALLALLDAEGLLHRVALIPNENVKASEPVRPFGTQRVDALDDDPVDVVIEE